jgi:tRNA pseudouridine38-40 synthase
MQRYFIELAYKGTNYHGWQIQPNSITVQGILNNTITKKINETIVTIGAGRTDSGVHAMQFFAHFDSENADLDKDDTLVHQLNGYLPQDIAIKKIIAVNNSAHARFDATSRTYKYFIARKKDAINYEFTNYVYGELDIDAMNKGAEFLVGHHDFKSFSKSNTDVKTNDCNVIEAKWELEENTLVFTIQADRFLRNMVRAIVGTLLDVGKEKVSLNELESIVASKNRSNAGESAAAKGLFLTKIEYPEHVWKLTVK